MARVTVTVTARDLTGPQLARMRRNFNNLGNDMDRVLTQRTRANFQRLSQSITTARRDLTNLRGAIPEDEFNRLDDAIRRAQNRMGAGFRRANLNRIAADLRQVTDGFRDLDRNGQIRVRIDQSALRRADARLAAWRTQQARNGVRIPVRPDVDRNRVRRGLLGTLAAPFSASGRVLGGVLSDGVGQGVSSGFHGAGPAIAAVLIAVIGAALSVVGAALSGILVTALGAAFVSIGVVSAFQSKQVQHTWSRTLANIKQEFAGVGEPLIPVLDKALKRLHEMAHVIGPMLKQSLADTAPATDKFIQRLMDGFQSFGKAAFKPIMDAWNVFAPVFGAEWNEFMDELGNSFKEMADLVREHPTEIAAALDVVFEAIDLLVDTVTFFGKVWVFTMQNAGDAVGGLVQGFSIMTDAVLGMVGGIIDGLAKAFGDIPIIGSQLKGAAKSFDEFATDVRGKLQSMADKAYGWDNALNKANRKRTLEADISTWTARLARARADLKKTSDQKARAKLEADISDLNAKVKAARAELNSLNGKTASTYVVTHFSYTGKNAALDRGAFAHGGVRGLSTAATGGVRSNMTLVGEHGPEIVNMAPGSHVRSNPDTRRTLSQQVAGGGNVIQVNLMVDKKVLARVMVDPLRGEIRDGGGNVQQFLGQRGK